jgi:hypothetical protein
MIVIRYFFRVNPFPQNLRACLLAGSKPCCDPVSLRHGQIGKQKKDKNQ